MPPSSACVRVERRAPSKHSVPRPPPRRRRVHTRAADTGPILATLWAVKELIEAGTLKLNLARLQYNTIPTITSLCCYINTNQRAVPVARPACQVLVSRVAPAGVHVRGRGGGGLCRLPRRRHGEHVHAGRRRRRAHLQHVRTCACPPACPCTCARAPRPARLPVPVPRHSHFLRRHAHAHMRRYWVGEQRPCITYGMRGQICLHVKVGHTTRVCATVLLLLLHVWHCQ